MYLKDDFRANYFKKLYLCLQWFMILVLGRLRTVCGGTEPCLVSRLSSRVRREQLVSSMMYPHTQSL